MERNQPFGFMFEFFEMEILKQEEQQEMATEQEDVDKEAILSTQMTLNEINCAFGSEALKEKSQFPFHHQLLPKKGFFYQRTIQVLLHFRWTLIGLFASDTEEGGHFMRTLTPTLVRNGICIVISQQFSTIGNTAPIREAISKWRQVNVYVHFIEFVSLLDRILPFHLALGHLPGPVEGKIWIMATYVDCPIKSSEILRFVHSIWNFALQVRKRRKDYGFEPGLFLEHRYEDKSFRCSFSKHIFSVKGRRRCTQKSPLETQKKRNSIWMGNDSYIYSFILTLAHALNAAYLSVSRRRRVKYIFGAPRLQPWQVWGTNKGPSNQILLEKESKGEVGEPSQPPCTRKGQQIWPI
uniref:Receptor ligand binding region domain-containing protein n=2 Tax=Micrurus carvalhoi TaxID=3147026 RepID=A0A2H6MZ11_9SAUR